MKNTLSSLQSVHILGIGGTLMGAFAAWIKAKGIQVTGSDTAVYPPMSDVLASNKIHSFTGYDADNLERLGGQPSLVVVGNVITAQNPEMLAVQKKGWRFLSLPEFMERYLLGETHNILVAGTHGKTTTTSMLSYVMRESFLDPSYFVGGVSPDLGRSFYVSDTHGFFVLEADEYDTAFWDKVPKFNHYLPRDVILTSVEYDHADIYANMDAVYKAFEGLIGRIAPSGRLIACSDYSHIGSLIKSARVPVITYGVKDKNARYQPAHIRFSEVETRFDILENGKQVGHLSTQLGGEHNILNALAVWIECRELGLSHEVIERTLATFKGVKRRLEVRAQKAGVTVIDDFAHHPTAVQETLKALRARFPKSKITVVFEPRSATSRRSVFQTEYARAFKQADRVFIASAFDQSKIDQSERFSSEKLVNDLRADNCEALHFNARSEELDATIAKICASRIDGEIVAVLSNGGFEGFIPKLIQSLDRL